MAARSNWMVIGGATMTGEKRDGRGLEWLALSLTAIRRVCVSFIRLLTTSPVGLSGQIEPLADDRGLCNETVTPQMV